MAAPPSSTRTTSRQPAAATTREKWFPTREAGDTTREALAICGTCPHEHACRAWAHAQPTSTLYGIWGGTTHADRKHDRK
ncbi:WhiB family transcriptional regulator [Micromonospora chalcea]|uniref:WhiB family transcriptional regulator n=1 Tax=Micromonospora chalcea TaxID=1874 RepID=UPI0035CD3515